MCAYIGDKDRCSYGWFLYWAIVKMFTSIATEIVNLTLKAMVIKGSTPISGFILAVRGRESSIGYGYLSRHMGIGVIYDHGYERGSNMN